MGLPFGGLDATLDFARIFYFSVSKNNFNTSGAAEHPFQHLIFFSPRMPFGNLGAFFLTFRDSIFAPREHLWKAFWHLRTTLGSHFGISGAPWEAILASRDHPGGPWEQEDGQEVANNRIFVDFRMISGPVYASFWSSKCV